MLELLFLLLIYAIYKSEIKSKIKYFLVGSSYALAILSKITSVLFGPTFLLFFLYVFLNKKCSISDLFYIAISLFLFTFLFGYFYVWPNVDNYTHMFRTSADSGNFTIGTIFLKNIAFTSFDMSFLKFPGTIIVGVGVLFYIFDSLRKILKEGFRRFLNNVSDLEVFCIFWIIFLSLSLSLNDQVGLDRRMVQLYVPFFILFCFFINNTKVNLDSIFQNKVLSATLIIIGTLLIAYYFASMYNQNISGIYDLGFTQKEKYNTLRLIPFFFACWILIYLNLHIRMPSHNKSFAYHNFYIC